MANIAAQSKTSERMKQMKQGFLELRQAGKSFSEIAEFLEFPYGQSMIICKKLQMPMVFLEKIYCIGFTNHM